MATWIDPSWLRRALALILALIGIPAALSIGAFVEEQPIRVGERSPRTVIAPNLIRVVDQEATEQARRRAA
ncbi:MAG: hypothetical protein M3N52_09975, partial [Actinomycetota bacterium]|nr:hypothetical protein [Actinomycetota bacterium]